LPPAAEVAGGIEHASELGLFYLILKSLRLMKKVQTPVNKTCWLNIRLAPDEHQEIESRSKKSTCRNMSEYARRVLLEQKIVTIERDGSLDKLMEELIVLRKELNQTGNNFNQIVRKINASNEKVDLQFWLPVSQQLQHQITSQIDIIQSKIDQLSKKWLQDS